MQQHAHNAHKDMVCYYSLLVLIQQIQLHANNVQLFVRLVHIPLNLFVQAVLQDISMLQQEYVLHVLSSMEQHVLLILVLLVA